MASNLYLTPAISNCFLCGIKLNSHHPHRESNSKLLERWKLTRAKSFCEVIHLEPRFQYCFATGNYCSKCEEIICNAEFAQNAIDRLQMNLFKIEADVKKLFVSHIKQKLNYSGDISDSNSIHRDETIELLKEIATSLNLKTDIDEENGQESFMEGQTQVHSIPVKKPTQKRLVKLKRRATPHRKIQYLDVRQRTHTELPSLQDIQAEANIKLTPQIELSYVSLPSPPSASADDLDLYFDEDSTNSADKIVNEQTIPLKENDKPSRTAKPPPSKKARKVSSKRKERKTISSKRYDKSRYANLVCNFDSCTEKEAFSSLEAMRIHIRECHDGMDIERILHCGNCSRRFRCWSGLEEHKLRAHGGEPLVPCPHCKKLFWTPKSVRHHIRCFHTKIQLNPKCKFCNKSYATHDLVAEHEILHNHLNPFQCVLCGKMADTTPDLFEHVNQCHEDLPFVCEYEGCGKRFETQYKLRNHTRNHGLLDKYKCSFCNYTSKNPSGIKWHEMGHTKVKNFKCQIEGCGMEFTWKTQLSMHTKRKHTDFSQSPYVCLVCSRRFLNLCLLKSHQIHHRKDRKFMCDICSLSFKTIKMVREHIALHSRPDGVHPKLSKSRKSRVEVV